MKIWNYQTRLDSAVLQHSRCGCYIRSIHDSDRAPHGSPHPLRCYRCVGHLWENLKCLADSYRIAISRKATNQENGDWRGQLASTIKQVRQGYENSKSDGISGRASDEDVSKIICCVIVAWAQSIPVIKLRVRRERSSSEDTTYMEDFPPVLALS